MATVTYNFNPNDVVFIIQSYSNFNYVTSGVIRRTLVRVEGDLTPKVTYDVETASSTIAVVSEDRVFANQDLALEAYKELIP